MKHSLILSLWLMYASTLCAQAPQKFSFQGVARDAAGKILSKRDIKLRATIHQGGAAGQSVYSETHTLQTDANGIFNLAIGTGFVNNGFFETIEWGLSEHFLQIEINPDGSNFIDLGSTQLLSIPYAIHAKESNGWVNGKPIVQLGTSQNSILSKINPQGPALIWYPLKSAFRTGQTYADEWEHSNIGNASFATGESTIAKGDWSAAFGYTTRAHGKSSFVHGMDVEALSNSSFTTGVNLIAKDDGAFTSGFYNDIQADNPAAGAHRIFQIGNGTPSHRSNALTVLRNGNIGIGYQVTVPKFVLDVGHRMRIRHSQNETAGIYFDNSTDSPAGFVGMLNDSQIGLYLDGWKFYVHSNGDAVLSGNLSQNSDRRLKKNFTSLSESLSKLSSLQGYNYFWKDTLKDQTIQTGLIAQEVETLFPELVKTDEKGYKSVNYIGLVPHLIEALKELQLANDILKSQNQKMQTESGKTVDAIKLLEARLNQLQEKLAAESN